MLNDFAVLLQTLGDKKVTQTLTVHENLTFCILSLLYIICLIIMRAEHQWLSKTVGKWFLRFKWLNHILGGYMISLQSLKPWCQNTELNLWHSASFLPHNLCDWALSQNPPRHPCKSFQTQQPACTVVLKSGLAQGATLCKLSEMRPPPLQTKRKEKALWRRERQIKDCHTRPQIKTF